MSPRSIRPLLAAVLVLVPAAALAQAPVPPDLRGSRVRVHAPVLGGLPLTGTLEEVHGDRIVVRLRDGEPVVLPAAALSDVEVARPRPTLQRNVTIGGTLGAVAGAGLYLSWCYADRDACRRDGQYDEHPEAAQPLTFGALAVVGGALVGGGLAYLLTPQRWETLALPIRLGVGPTSHGGLSLGASIGHDR